VIDMEDAHLLQGLMKFGWLPIGLQNLVQDAHWNLLEESET
jgi:hypothetical protein